MANEKRLIDANELEAKFHETKMIAIFPYWKELNFDTQCELVKFGKALKKMMQTAPTVDAVEVVHGRWNRKQIGKYTGADEVVCSCCGYFIAVVCSDTGFNEAIKGMNYCPNCGAKMDGDGNA